MATYKWPKAFRDLYTTGCYYIDPVLGLDTNDGSANAPKKNPVTAANAKNLLADGTYDLSGRTSADRVAFYGNKNVTVKNAIITGTNVKFYGITLKNCNNTGGQLMFISGCAVYDSILAVVGMGSYNNKMNVVVDSSFINASGAAITSGNTFIRCTAILTGALNPGYGFNSNVFKACNINFAVSFAYVAGFRYNLIDSDCLIDINGTNYRAVSYWESVTGLSGMAAIQSAYNAVYVSGTLSAANNKIADVKLTDYTNGNYMLQSTSPAIGWGLSGINCGCYGIGKKTNIMANSHGSVDVVDVDTTQNVTITANNIEVIHNELNQMPNVGYFFINYKFQNPAKVDSIIIKGTDYSTYGEIIDSSLSISTTPIIAGTALEDGQIYRVGEASITYSSTVYAIDSLVRAVGTNPFTGYGYLYKVNDYPNYKTIEARWKLTVPNNPIVAGTDLEENCWYEVISEIVYNGSTRIASDVFRCETGITSFTGGSVKKIFDSTDTFYKFIYNTEPAFKRVGNTVNGDIDVTNGELSYNDATNDARESFYISCRYLQLKVTIQNNAIKQV